MMVNEKIEQHEDRKGRRKNKKKEERTRRKTTTTKRSQSAHHQIIMWICVYKGNKKIFLKKTGRQTDDSRTYINEKSTVYLVVTSRVTFKVTYSKEGQQRIIRRFINTPCNGDISCTCTWMNVLHTCVSYTQRSSIAMSRSEKIRMPKILCVCTRESWKKVVY